MTGPIRIRVEQAFHRPRDQAFDAFLDPARVGQWLFRTPEGVMERADYNPRPGGDFTIFERRGDDLARHFGRFVEITRPDGDGSRAVLTHDLAPEWAAYAERTTGGWTMILDNLHHLIEA